MHFSALFSWVGRLFFVSVADFLSWLLSGLFLRGLGVVGGEGDAEGAEHGPLAAGVVDAADVVPEL